MTLGEKEVASNMLALLKRSILSLDEMPGRYRFYDVEPWKSRGVHIMPVKKCLVFYVVNDNINSVDIFRVIYGSRSIDEVLK